MRSTDREGATMANDHRRVGDELVQGVLLDDPGFLREVVERVIQQVLEAEMTEHIGAAPHERGVTRTGHRNGYKPMTLRTRVGTLNLLVPRTARAPSPLASFRGTNLKLLNSRS